MTRPPPLVLPLLLVLPTLGSASGSAPPEPGPPPGPPGLALQERLEVHLAERAAELYPLLGHYGLVFEVRPEALQHFMRRIVFRRDGEDVAVGALHAPESHGGGVLALLVDHWRPEGRPARPEDRFFFEGNGESLALRTLYESHRRQVFLPAEGTPAAPSDSIPRSPTLARMEFSFRLGNGVARPVETDAYRFLGVLLAWERDTSRTWVNGRGQTLSADLLLEHAWRHFLEPRSVEAELADHSNLHLVELLLRFHAMRESAGRPLGEGFDPNALKRHFLASQLAPRLPPHEAGELLAHRAESLGFLLADPHVTWAEAERRRVRTWLRELQSGPFRELESHPVNHLSHLLRGLRMVRERWHELEPAGS